MKNDLVRNNVAHRFDEQSKRWIYTYTVDILVPNGGSATANLNISNDADFDIEEITGRMMGPVDANGLFLPAHAVPNTDFPYPASSANASSGVMIKMTDQGDGIELQNDFVYAETILAPGYSPTRYQSTKWPYLLMKNSNLRIDCRNRDTVAGAYHLLSMTFKGYKYR